MQHRRSSCPKESMARKHRIPDPYLRGGETERPRPERGSDAGSVPEEGVEKFSVLDLSPHLPRRTAPASQHLPRRTCLTAPASPHHAGPCSRVTSLLVTITPWLMSSPQHRLELLSRIQPATRSSIRSSAMCPDARAHISRHEESTVLCFVTIGFNSVLEGANYRGGEKTSPIPILVNAFGRYQHPLLIRDPPETALPSTTSCLNMDICVSRAEHARSNRPQAAGSEIVIPTCDTHLHGELGVRHVPSTALFG